MATPAIRVESVGKRYTLGVTHGSGHLLSERVQDALAAPIRALRPGPEPSGPRRGAIPPEAR